MADDALTTAAAEVLAAHRLIWGVRNGWSCLCGFIGGSGDSGLRGCEDHRAERVAHLVREHAAAKQAEALRAFADTRGVNVGDEGDEWWLGYRQAQRECLRDALDRAERLHTEPAPDGGDQ